jgi:four helix bundle protein
MQRFTEFEVWQRGHFLALSFYRMTTGFPQNERYGLTSQLRRAALSVTANIAAGAKRLTPTRYGRFRSIAEAALAETENVVMVSRDLGYVTPAVATKSSPEISGLSRMLHALRKKAEAAGVQTPQ